MLAPFELAKAVPLPKPDANKYTRGKCVLLVGSKPYPGAACLSSWASQYVGAGVYRSIHGGWGTASSCRYGGHRSWCARLRSVSLRTLFRLIILVR